MQSHQSATVQNRLVVLVGLLSAQTAFAYPGQRVLEFAAQNIIAPLGLMSVVLGITASFFRPELVRSSVYTLILCAVLFFIIRSAPTLMSALSQG